MAENRTGYFSTKHDTATNLSTENPTLPSGVFGFETDTGKLKMGDGSTTWNDLIYIAGLNGADGADGANGTDGTDGISIDWLGSLATAPVSPTLNQGYYNTTDKISYIWDGSTWQILAQDGADGADGVDGADGTNGIDGTNGSDGVDGVDGQVKFKPLTIGYAGDSISVQWAREDCLSGMFWYKNLFNPCLIDNIFNTGKGGSPSSALISEYLGTTAQIEVLEALADEDVPDLMLVHTTQNDYFGTYTHAETESLNVTTYCDRALAKGVKNIIVVGHPPKTGTDEPSVLAYLNRIISTYAENTEGVHFLDVLSLWREIPTGEDASNGGIDWRLGYSTDGTHPSSKAMYDAGKLLAPILDSLVQGKELQPTTASKFNYTTTPYNNVIGLEGLFLGTNGKYNGVDNVNVAGSTTSEYWELSDGNGVVATPSIVVGDDGYNYQQIVLSGTAIADQNIILQFSDYYSSIPEATYIEEAKLHLSDITGVNSIELGMDVIGAKAISNNGQDFNGENVLHVSEKIDFAGQSASTRVFKLTISVLNGESPSGTIKLGRCGIFRQA